MKNERIILESDIGGKCLVQVVYKEPCFVMVVRITTKDVLSGTRRGCKSSGLGLNLHGLVCACNCGHECRTKKPTPKEDSGTDL
ncbi:hypothetical protein PanWU01x14_067260 [Parasponia andersonii]|uniref:Uncharacterized protein n=1 Tax=Parasponia andersonii TaxID=3476 RepID=A0A2P5DGC2_PARAD|nr:hypothetical protein PanWU01x14_067260 [Parasponia andersonii]